MGSGGNGSGVGNCGSNGKRGIMKYFSRSNDSSKNCNNGSNHSSSATSSHPSAPASINGVDSKGECRSASCCGMQRVLYQLNNRDPKRSQESLNSASMGVNGNPSLGNETDSLLSNGQMEDVWLECDDETISLISR